MANEAPPHGQGSEEPAPLSLELANRHPRDTAEELRDLPLARVRDILGKLPDALAAEVISELPREVQVRLFESMEVSCLSGIVGKMFSDDVADVLGHVSSARLREILSGLPAEEARQISDLLKYPEDTAGGIMQTEVISVSEDLSIAEGLERLRREEEDLPNGIFYIYVTDSERRLRGVLRVRDLLFRPSNLRIRDIMVPEVRAVSVHADQEEIARLFRAYGFSAIPVVDDFQRLRGVVTADDVLDIVEEEATEDMQRMVGLSGEETAETPWRQSVRNRLPWLYVNLATAFLAGWVVSLFETTIAKYAVLAIFLPIIAGQGGNAGTQTLTIIVRSIALGNVPETHHRSILIKEILVGSAQWSRHRSRRRGSFVAVEERPYPRRDHFRRDGAEHGCCRRSRRVDSIRAESASHRPCSCFCNHAHDSHRRRWIFSVPRPCGPCSRLLSRCVIA